MGMNELIKKWQEGILTLHEANMLISHLFAERTRVKMNIEHASEFLKRIYHE